MEKLRVFEAFAGYGSQSMALERLGIDFEVVGISEIDKYAIQAYNAVHGETKNYGDISKIDWNEVPDFDFMTYSFPCGLAGTKVKTSKGYKNIEKVLVGDKVLTHNNRYCKVIRTMSRICPDYYNINAIGCKLKLTAEHPLYVLRDGIEQWIKVKDLQKTDKLSYCIPQENNLLYLSNEELWLLGRYVADGFVNKYLYNSVLFAIGCDKESEFLENIPKKYADRFHKTKKTCYEYRIADKSIQSLCLEFGTGAKNKQIPEWLINADKEQIKCFLNGYFSGDGHVRYRSGTKVQMFTTVSKNLFLGIQTLMLKCYGKICSLTIRHDERKETFNDTYNGQLCFSASKHQQIIGERIFVAIKKVEKVEKEVQVFNLEVEHDNSYTCDNVNTHNCTDISTAGKQKGLAEGSGTRSSRLWECKKPIEAKRPKYLLMENVKALTFKKFLPYLNEWTAYLESLGYTCYTKILNSKKFGVPQNRERCFMVSILGNDKFFFPEEFPLETRLKDVLEKNVDEKYYLSKEIVSRFKPIIGSANIVGTTEPSFRSIGQRDLVYGENGCMGALTATDYKQLKQIFEPKIDIIGNYHDSGHSASRVVGIEGISPTVMENHGTVTAIAEPQVLTPKRTEYGKSVRKAYESGELEESRHNMTEMQPKETSNVPLRIPQATSKGYIEVEPGGIFDGSYPNSKTRRGRVQEGGLISPTITSQGEPLNVYEGITEHFHEECCQNYRIRKLTPRECFRLMGVSDSDIDKIEKAGISRSQCYKLAGNSIVVDVLCHIFRKMFVEKECEAVQLSLF